MTIYLSIQYLLILSYNHFAIVYWSNTNEWD